MRRIKDHGKEKARCFFAQPAAVLLFLLFLPLAAGASSVTLEYKLGFNGLFTLNTWTPVTIIVENSGRNIKGHLEILATSGSEYRGDVYTRTYSTPVELPTYSKKQYQLTVFIESFAHPLIIRLKEDQKEISTRSINLRSHYRTQELLVFIDSLLRINLDSDQGHSLIPIFSRGSFLPEVWYGYDGVRLLVMPAKAWQDINQRQLAALEEWVTRGGCLVAAGGMNYGSLTDKRLSRLLPLNISGIREVRDLGSLEAFTGLKFTARGPALLVEAELKGAHVKLKEQDIPVLSQRAFGRGSVFFLAFDFASALFREWNGQQNLWIKLLSQIKEESPSFFNPPDQTIYNLMIDNLSLGFPSFIWAVLLATLYIAPVLFILKKIETKKTRRWNYLGLAMLWVVMTSLVFYGIFFTKSSHRDLSTNQFTMVRLAGPEPVPLFKEFIGLYNLKSRSTDVRLGDDSYPVKGFMFERTQDTIGQFFNLEERFRNQIIHLDLDRWSHRFFSLEGRLSFPVKAGAVEDENGLVLKIENRSPYQIDLCRLYYDQRFFDIDPIPAQKSMIYRIDRELVAKEPLYHLKEKNYSDNAVRPKKPNNLFSQMPMALRKDLSLSIHSGYKERRDLLHLTGWINGAVKPITLDLSGPRKEAVTLVEWEIPIEK